MRKLWRQPFTKTKANKMPQCFPGSVVKHQATVASQILDPKHTYHQIILVHISLHADQHILKYRSVGPQIKHPTIKLVVIQPIRPNILNSSKIQIPTKDLIHVSYNQSIRIYHQDMIKLIVPLPYIQFSEKLLETGFFDSLFAGCGCWCGDERDGAGGPSCGSQHAEGVGRKPFGDVSQDQRSEGIL